MKPILCKRCSKMLHRGNHIREESPLYKATIICENCQKEILIESEKRNKQVKKIERKIDKASKEFDKTYKDIIEHI